jgi:hypothetical protein
MTGGCEEPGDQRHIRQLEFELEKADHGMALPYDAERVRQLRKMLLEARQRKLFRALAAKRRPKGAGSQGGFD